VFRSSAARIERCRSTKTESVAAEVRFRGEAVAMVLVVSIESGFARNERSESLTEVSVRALGSLAA
jgi:hypothetical protein